MKVIFKIQRFNPQEDQKASFDTYSIDVEESARVLDALQYISRNIDSTLAYRKSCAHGVCGSDAMRINGKECLACKTLIKNVVQDNTIIIEPLANMDVMRDLVVNYDGALKKFRSVRPYLIPAKKAPEKEYLQSQEARENFDEASKCINCTACYSACPIVAEQPGFLGPNALIQAIRYINDDRDQGLEARIDVLDNPNGVWGCQQMFHCTRVCPRGIKVTKLINQTKKQIVKYRESRGEIPNKGD